MTLKQLRYMLAVAQYKSINEAAKKCFISQPSLSNAIKDLEEEIGLELFIRTAKGITLTAEGSEFLKYAQTGQTVVFHFDPTLRVRCQRIREHDQKEWSG